MYKKTSAAVSNDREQLHQRRQLPIIHVSKLLVVDGVDSVLELVEQMQPRPRNPCRDEPSILVAALARDEPAVFEPIQETSDVRHLAHEPLANFVAAQPVGLGAAKDPEHVVLRCRDAERLHRTFELMVKHRCRALNTEVRLMLQVFERLRLLQLALQFGRHAQRIGVITPIVKAGRGYT